MSSDSVGMSSWTQFPWAIVEVTITLFPLETLVLSGTVTKAHPPGRKAPVVRESSSRGLFIEPRIFSRGSVL